MKKATAVSLCIGTLLLGGIAGGVLDSILSKAEGSENTARQKMETEFLGTDSCTEYTIGNMSDSEVQGHGAYKLADDLIADAYNSPDNYSKYSDVISKEDFGLLIPYISGSGEDIRSDDDSTGEFYKYCISDLKFTADKAAVSYFFEYWQYNKTDCRSNVRRDHDEIYEPVTIFMVNKDGKWQVDHIYDPP